MKDLNNLFLKRGTVQDILAGTLKVHKMNNELKVHVDANVQNMFQVKAEQRDQIMQEIPDEVQEVQEQHPRPDGARGSTWIDRETSK
jgi:hypothetical protein